MARLYHKLNYKEASEILTDRFGNKQIIISSHMEALLKLQPVNAMSNVKGIRAVLDNLEIQVRGLQALGIDSAQYGALLIPIFMEKLPEELPLIVICGEKNPHQRNRLTLVMNRLRVHC